MNHARSFDVPNIGPKALRNLRVETTFPEKIRHQARKVGLALSVLLAPIGFMPGCNSPSNPGNQSHRSSGQNFGYAPTGYNPYHQNPQYNGWASSGNNARPLIAPPLGEAPMEENYEPQQPVRPMLTREEMMGLLECYRLTPEDAAQLGEDYESIRRFDAEHQPPATNQTSGN